MLGRYGICRSSAPLVYCSGSKDETTQAAVKAIKEAQEEEKKEELRARKLATKAAFDTAYDQGGGARAVDKGAQHDGEEDDMEAAGDSGTRKSKGLGWAR